jgi:hypothetical protein
MLTCRREQSVRDGQDLTPTRCHRESRRSTGGGGFDAYTCGGAHSRQRRPIASLHRPMTIDRITMQTHAYHTTVARGTPHDVHRETPNKKVTRCTSKKTLSNPNTHSMWGWLRELSAVRTRHLVPAPHAAAGKELPASSHIARPAKAPPSHGKYSSRLPMESKESYEFILPSYTS